MTLNTKVFELYKGNHKNLLELARAIGISRSQIYRVKQGTRGINQGFIIGATKAFPEYNLDDLFYVDAEGQPVKSSNKWPEFRDYARQKYPELDEDLITMIEDLIERRRGSSQNDDGR